MKDVTYLDNREKGHPDFTTFESARARVTLKMLVRPEFQEATEAQQEVYILRLASAFFTKLIHLTEDEMKKLDQCAVDVGLQVTQIEAIAPRKDWSASFQGVMRNLMAKELPSKFGVQRDMLELEVERYKKGLPPGMKPSEDFMTLLRARPHRILLRHMEADDDMHASWRNFEDQAEAGRARADAEIALFKAEALALADKKKAIDAAKRAAAASAEKVASLEKEARDAAKGEIFPVAPATASS
ncbi:unnamed protein product, partial [Laminaria digitata]